MSEIKPVWSMTQEILDATKRSSFEEGVRHALENLRATYGVQIEWANIWDEYMKEGEE
jgi:hypothetical protein